MIYVKAEFNVHPGRMAAYVELMRDLVPIMAELRWRLVAGFVNDSGRQNAITNVWELPDGNTFTSFRACLEKVPRGVEILSKVRECIEPETITLVKATAYSPVPFA